MLPNIVIFKIDDQLHDATLNGAGEMLSVQPFDSDYEVNDNHIVFASYDTHTHSSVEVCRFTIHATSDESARTVKEVLTKEGKDGLISLIKHIFENEVIKTV